MLMGMQIITVIVLIMALIIIMFGLLKYLIDSEKAYIGLYASVWVNMR